MSTVLQKDSAMTEVAKLIVDGDEVDLPVVVGTEDEKAVDITKLRDETGLHHARRRLHEHGRDAQRHHVSRRRKGHPALSRLSDRAARRELRLHRGRVPADLRRIADGRRSSKISA